MRQKVTPEQAEAMVQAYLDGATMKQAASMFGYAANTFQRILKKRNIKTRTISEAAYRVPQEEEQEIIKAYLAGASLKKAGAKFGHNGTVCLQILRRNGVKSRTRAEAGRQYRVDESFFDVIDTEEKAYWLGFITADGMVKGYEIVIILKASDAEHLRKFLVSLNSDYQLFFRKTQRNGKTHEQVSIRMNCKRLAEALKNLGVTENKSITAAPCLQVPQHLTRHYWRGLVDGDGSITVNKPNTKYYVISLVGTEAIVSGFQEFISQFIQSEAKVRPNGNIFQIVYGGRRQVSTIVKVLYGDAKVYLDRKMALAARIMESD